MTEIKPVYQRRIQDDDWQEIEHSEYVEFSERGKFQTRILYHAAAYEALQKENAELKESLGNSLEYLKNECKAFADCRPRPYSMSQAEQEAWFSCWNSIYDDINNLDLSKYAETKKAVL